MPSKPLTQQLAIRANLLVIPEAREEEALEELGDKVILASRVRILDTKRDSTSVLLRVKALDTVQLKKLVTGDTLGSQATCAPAILRPEVFHRV